MHSDKVSFDPHKLYACRRTLHLQLSPYCSPLLVRLFGLPIFFILLLVFYRAPVVDGGVRNGLLFNMIVLAALTAPFVAVCTVGGNRRRYYQESYDGAYGGPAFILSQMLVHTVEDVIAVGGAVAIDYWLLLATTVPGPVADQWLGYGTLCGTIGAVYLTAMYGATAMLAIVRSEFVAAGTIVAANVVSIIYATGTLK